VNRSSHSQPLTRLPWVAVTCLSILVAACASQSARSDADASAPIGPFAEFVEPDFPFITSTVDAREVGASFPDDNVATRGIVLLLGDSTYVTFDPDLLRMAVGWRGEFLSMTAMAQVSYSDSLNKNNRIPTVLGRPVAATGIYPGWSAGTPSFTDPRAPGPFPGDPGRGPLAPSEGRWEGVYVVGNRAVLRYTVRGVAVEELYGTARAGSQVGITRTLRTGPVRDAITLVVAEARGAKRVEAQGSRVLFHEAAGDTVTAVAVVSGPQGAALRVVGDRYATLELPAGLSSSLFRVVMWRGPAGELASFGGMLEGPPEMIDFEEGGPGRWDGVVTTAAELAPDTAAFVVDEIALPIGNRWRRNVRPSDIAFFDDGRAAVSTYEGDVWLVEGLEDDLDAIEWRRFASGLYEPMSLEVVDGEIYVYSRNGLVRPRDLNGDGEADFYENFSDLSVQTMESREFPLSMAKKPGGGFYLSRGGALDNGPRTSPRTFPGFRAGSAYSGSVVEVSEDGSSLRYFATGLREPFIAVHPGTGMITASDQQGNFVPSTPVYRIEQGGYYGVPATAHREPIPEAGEAVAWIPHEVDQSGAGQAWVPEGMMGFSEDALIHVSFGRPGVFRVYFDEASGGAQGAVISLSDDFAAPLLKGEVSPEDEQLYVAGFNIWGSRSMGIRTLARVRRTDRPSVLPEAVSVGEQGVLLRFGVPLDPATATDPSKYDVSRWNYQRTEQYGSGHFKLDGVAGEERLPVASAHVSDDRRTLLLVVPDMREVMQFQVAYDLRGGENLAVTDTLYLTVNRVASLDLAAVGLGEVDWKASIAAAGSVAGPAEDAASAAQGAAIFQRTGCVACHSVDGTTAGKLGPTLQGLFGSNRALADGSSVRADADYIRRSIKQPGAQIAAGFQEGMPAYLGVLSDTEIESIVLYIQSLAN
jgi:mono/diheme cytochrome c family protein